MVSLGGVSNSIARAFSVSAAGSVKSNPVACLSDKILTATVVGSGFTAGGLAVKNLVENGGTHGPELLELVNTYGE